MTTAAVHLPALRRHLEALEAVIAVRTEERVPPPLARRLGLDGDGEGIPGLDRYTGPDPIGEIVRTTGLTAAEALILVAAVAPHVDEKFDVLFAGLTDRPGATGLTGEVARTLVARSFAGRIAAGSLFHRDSALVGLGLLRLDPPENLAGTVVADPELVRFVLGLRAGTPATSADFPARPLTTVHTLDDVVLPGSARARIDELKDRIANRDLVVGTWGYGRFHDNTTGLIALFHGAPGTGKTMTAAALARSTGLPAYLVDLSALVSKYIGETEKNLARVFDRCAREGSVLVFDEADAVFGRRTEVSDSHDRYANQEVSYLLSRVEQHPGVVILTSNLLSNIDEAFQRRIHVMVEFPEPGVGERMRLWRSVLPPDLPVVADIDFDALAERFPLSGAQIRDAGLEAAYLAAADGHRVTTPHLLAGIQRQFEKAGRTAPR